MNSGQQINNSRAVWQNVGDASTCDASETVAVRVGLDIAQKFRNTMMVTRLMETPDTRNTDTDAHSVDQNKSATWGPWLFGITLVVTLVFFWWLVIYSHGVTPHG